MKIAVCDDDKRIREILKKDIHDILPDAEITVWHNGTEFMESLSNPDILILDIEMPGINGIELAEMLRRSGKEIVIIFISGEEKYVWQAFDVEALQYLRKPFTVDDLRKALERAVAKIRDLNTDHTEEAPSMVIHYKGIHEKVFISDIVYAEAMGRKVILHRMTDTVEYYGKISDLENMLGGDFFRVHRAFLINLNYVTRYEADGITLKNGFVNISKANYPLFVKRFLQFTADRTSRGNDHDKKS